MARTTVDIDTPILKKLKTLQKKEHRSLGQLISQLLSEALVHRNKGSKKTLSLNWISRPMQAQVDLMDKESVYEILDEKTQ